MDTVELQHILDHSCLLYTLKAKVCPKDLLPIHKVPHTRAYIVNTQDSDQPGEHWVALFFKNNEAVYFDSYGLPPLQHHILPFLESNCRRWSMNSMRLQGDYSMLCGVYCIYALHYLTLGYPMDKLLTLQFHPQRFDDNDNAVGHWFKKCYGQLYDEAQTLPKTTVGKQCCVSTKGSKQQALDLFRMYVLLR